MLWVWQGLEAEYFGLLLTVCIAVKFKYSNILVGYSIPSYCVIMDLSFHIYGIIYTFQEAIYICTNMVFMLAIHSIFP